jgi:hypothetical protein
MDNFDKAIEISLRTWYPLDHPLHFNPHHPLGKLLGEWGELLDDYMKSLYKPGYIFEPEDELGDIWYYIRILAYQANYIPEDKNYFYPREKTELVITCAIQDLSKIFGIYIKLDRFHEPQKTLDYIYTIFIEIVRRYNLTLDDLTASNWEKLKPGSVRGDQWMKARGT